MSSFQVPYTSGGGGVTDHGALTGLSDNDHPQYWFTDGDNNVTATGTVQGDAYAITKHVTRITSGSTSTGVRLPACVVGSAPYIVLNAVAGNPGAGSTSFVKVYPATGESVSGLGANSNDNVYAGGGNMYIPLTTGAWRTIALTAKSSATSVQMAGSHTFYSAISAQSGISITGGGISVAAGGAAVTGSFSVAQGSTLTTAGTTITVNWTTAGSAEIDLQGASGDVTLTLSNPVSGGRYTIKVIQGSTARNIIWPATVKWPGGAAPTISVANDAIDFIQLYWDGTQYLATFHQAFA